jgi:trk system potassium uptake protein TrkA
MQNKRFLVIGLGRFGSALALKLKQLGCYVFGVDSSTDLVNEFSHKLNQTMGGDTTNDDFVRSLDVHTYDIVVLAIGTNVPASVMSAVILKDFKAKKIVAKALTEAHSKLLEKIGVETIVYPEKEAGERLANQLVSPNLLELIELSPIYRVAEISVPRKFDGYTIARINPGGKYNVNIVAVNRYLNSNDLIIAPKADVGLRHNDRLVVIGNKENIDRFEREVIDKD